MLCASLTETDVEAMIEAAEEVDTVAVELRIDFLSDFSELERLREIDKKKVVTCMPYWEGGRFNGTEEERFALLERSLIFADLVTVELNAEKRYREDFIKKAKAANVKVIVAFHDFTLTPPNNEIIKTLNDEIIAGADIAKVAYTANKFKDAIRLLEVLVDQQGRIAIIASSMGEHGKIARALTPLLGSYMTFVAPNKEKASAPGQLSAADVRTVMEMLEVPR